MFRRDLVRAAIMRIGAEIGAGSRNLRAEMEKDGKSQHPDSGQDFVCPENLVELPATFCRLATNLT